MKKVNRIKKVILDTLCSNFVYCYYNTIAIEYFDRLDYIYACMDARKIVKKIMGSSPSQQKELLSTLKKVQFKYSLYKDIDADSFFSKLVEIPVERVVDTHNKMKKNKLIKPGIDVSKIFYWKRKNKYSFKKMQNVDSSILEILSNK